jgi:anaerobic magnesium-protoporphyrin IX monomethyl ester cyclase
MTKGTQVAELLTARERLRCHGIRVGFFIQLGYLGEELEDIMATRQLIEQAAPDDIGVSVSYPLPGTKFYERVKSQLGQKTHWQDSDDLTMMFRGAYDSDFYRAVRDLLHEQISLQHSQGAGWRSARAALDAKWNALLATELDHRTTNKTARHSITTSHGTNQHVAAP